jgi:hypothetical protein
MVKRLLDELGQRTRTLALHRLSDRTFADLSHDRYVRCDSWLLKLDTGPEPFSTGGMKRARVAFDMSVCSNEFLGDRRAAERRLKSRASGTLELQVGVACLKELCVG